MLSKTIVETIMGKQKKWVICCGYSGRGYFGMQRLTRDNKTIEEFPTIENELLKAFRKSGLITEDEFQNPSSLHFQRAARTDKGVSAIKQIISLASRHTDVPGLIPTINQSLPEHIRVFGAKRATKYFDCKNFCDARTYSYLMPSFSIAPSSVTDGDISAKAETYRLDRDRVDEFNTVLKFYHGTHNFHNFTSQKKPSDPSAKRYIMHFECSPPFVIERSGGQMEFLVARVKGQSFMLHQIRKMLGLAIAVMRGFTDSAVIDRAFGTERIDVPMAPGLGLLLEDVHFDRYNKKYGGDGVHVPLLWDEFNDQIQELKEKHIYPDIVETEIKESSMVKWMETLSLHTYGPRSDETTETNEKRNLDDETSQDHQDQQEDGDEQPMKKAKTE